MHYYQFNIADWVLHTNHLTLEEEAVYRRLIDHYYDTEKPIPAFYTQVSRRLRLAEYSAVIDDILTEFFTLSDGEWHHSRCDKEIEIYHKKAVTARINGVKGGRPKKENNPEITQSVNLANPEITGSKANQELLTINQELETKVKTKRFVPPTREELIQHCTEKRITVNVDKFLNHYESNGWRVGKNKMKSWKATLSNWGIRDAEDRQGTINGSSGKTNRTLSGNELIQQSRQAAADWLRSQGMDEESHESNDDTLDGTFELIR